MPIKVRVGQTEAVKILASAGGGSISAVSSKNVIGGIASVTELDVSGISTLSNVTAGILTATSFIGPLTGDVTGNLDGGAINADSLKITGLSTFTGIVTTVSDLYVGRNLFIKNDVEFDEFNARNLNITGISTFTGNAEFKANVSIGGTLTYEDVTNVDSVGLITARTGIRINTGGLIVTAGVSTFNNDVVFQGAAANQKITFDHSENDLEFSDLARAKFGDNDDLEIFHGSGNDSHIKNSTNDLKIRSDSLILKRADDSEAYLKATVNSDVKIYFNGNEKFATTGIGITVLGNTESQTLNITGIGTISSLGVTGTLTAGLIDGGAF